MKNQTLAIIPARFESSRFPGKPLALIEGQTMIQRVYQATKQAKNVADVYVATDDDRIFKNVLSFGGKALMTSRDLQCGTDRIYEASKSLKAKYYVNVQGDEPLIKPESIDEVAQLIWTNKFDIATLCTPIESKDELKNESVVKVLFDHNQKAIYFSRFAIPYSRGLAETQNKKFICQKHIGIYAYSDRALMQFCLEPPSEMERAESLEQLRALDMGFSIGVKSVNFTSMAVDTPDDLNRVVQWIKKNNL